MGAAPKNVRNERMLKFRIHDKIVANLIHGLGLDTRMYVQCIEDERPGGLLRLTAANRAGERAIRDKAMVTTLPPSTPSDGRSQNASPKPGDSAQDAGYHEAFAHRVKK